MAIFRCELSSGSRQGGQSAKAKIDYISRQEKYADHSDRCIHFESKIPTGFDSPQQFWDAADEHERANARLFQEFKLTLPIEHKQNIPAQIEAVKEFIAKTIPDHPYSFALHAGKGTNPHAHLVFSERVIDDVNREPEIFFKRANKKTPERGGAAKNRALKSKDFLIDARESWATCVNDSLQKHANTLQKVLGNVPQVDHRSRKEQGLEPVAPAHLTKAIEDKIKHMEVGDGISDQSNSRKNDKQRLRDAKHAVREHAIDVRERFKSNFGQTYKLDRQTKDIDRRIRRNSKQSVNDFDRALKETDKELERAIEQSCKRTSEAIQRQGERALQRSQGIEQQLRNLSDKSRELKKNCSGTRQYTQYVAEALERARDKQPRKQVIERIRNCRAIEETCRGIESFGQRTADSIRQLHERNQQTNRRINAIGDRRSIKESVVEIVKKVFSNVKKAIKINLMPEFKHKTPGGIKDPGLPRERTISFSLEPQKIKLPSTPKKEREHERKFAHVRLERQNKISRENENGISMGR